MRYQVVLEYDPETKSFSATVAGLPIFVDADTEREALKLAKEALLLYLEETKGRRRSPQAVRPGRAKVVTVEI